MDDGGSHHTHRTRAMALVVASLLGLAVSATNPPALGANPKPPTLEVSVTSPNESVYATVLLNRSADSVEAITCTVDTEPVSCTLVGTKRKRSTFAAEQHGLPDGEHVFAVEVDLDGGESATGSFTFEIHDVPAAP